MKKMILLLLPVCLWAQSYYETSGQTQAFTLAAGNKSAWNQSVAVESAQLKAVTQVSMGITPNPSTGILRIDVDGNAGSVMVAIYNVAGKRVQNVIMNNRNAVVLENRFANGIYFAQLHVKGKQMQTTRFLVVR
ncbi:MAG: T9SS type A sorting domain-containing protein [Fibrobacteres bacterium]|nr:T9SS type A sorting domain-containing protein [Fibrobacterota bacterium]